MFLVWSACWFSVWFVARASVEVSTNDRPNLQKDNCSDASCSLGETWVKASPNIVVNLLVPSRAKKVLEPWSSNIWFTYTVECLGYSPYCWIFSDDCWWVANLVADPLLRDRRACSEPIGLRRERSKQRGKTILVNSLVDSILVKSNCWIPIFTGLCSIQNWEVHPMN